MRTRTLETAPRLRSATLAVALIAAGCRTTPAAPARTAAAAARTTAAATAPHTVAPRTSADAIAALDARIAGLERLAARQRNDWLDLELVAQAWLERAGLSGSYDDYAHAEETLERAMRLAPAGAGPIMTRANLNYTLHRLARVEPDLQVLEHAAVVPRDQRPAIASLRADVAFHSGRYADARAGYERELAARRSLPALVNMAQYDWKTGDFRGAEALLDEAFEHARDNVEQRAFLCLVRGLMEVDRGRLEPALALFRRGLELRPGHRALQDHAAETLVALGRDGEALPLYQDLVNRTNDPEFMDALGQIQSRRGNARAANDWTARARALYEARLARFPEATAGHALEFFLRHDPQAAVHIAEMNRDARPGGEAQVLLARAYLAVGRLADARAVIESTLATAWNTAALHGAAADLFERLGERERAQSERARADAISPRTAAPRG